MAELLAAGGGQGGHVHAPTAEAVLLAVLTAALLVALVFLAVYLRRRHRRTRPVADQWGALAVMGELCPFGWQAHVTLYGWGAPVPEDAPPSRVPLVELEWQEFDEVPGHVAVSRRVWAPTIEEALRVMVEDRRTHVQLEQIEQSIAEAGDGPLDD